MQKTSGTWEEPVRLGKHYPVSRTTIHGGASILFGLPFLAAGIGITLITTGHFSVPAKDIHAPLWVIGVAGAMFFLVGVFLMLHGFDGMKRKRRLKKGKYMAPHRPWMWDYAWEPLGISENKKKGVINALVAMGVYIAFLSPFNWLVFYSEEVLPVWVKGVVIVFDLIILFVVYDFVRKLSQYLKYGDSRLRFKNFPFVLGGKMVVSLAGAPPQFEVMRMNLRFIEEAYEESGSGRNRSQDVVCYQRYGEEKVLRSHDAGGSKIVMAWQLPEDSEFTTQLSVRPAKFWELEIKAETPGVDYESRFLLPIYAKP